MAVNLIITLKNTTAFAQSWGGKDIPATSEIDIEEVDRLRLLSDTAFITALYAGEAVVADSEYDLTPRIAIGLLQYNPIIMSEYYTLTQEDGALIGNGQILYLNDDSWSKDEGEQDDYPTEE